MARYRCTPSERLFIALNELGEGEGMISSGIRIRGIVDAARLEDALRRLQARHAKLRCRVEYDRKEWPWFVEMDPLLPIDCEFRDVSDPESAAEDVLLNSWPGTFPIDKSGGVHLIVLKCAATDSTDIVGWFHHTVFDGPAVWLFFRELLEAYADPNACTQPAPGGFDVKPNKPPSLWGDWAWFNTAIWHRVILQKLNPSVTFRDRHIGAVAYSRTILPAELTRRIVETCRREKATMTGALSAAVCAVVTNECSWHGRKISIPTPRDARADFAPPIEKGTIGCFATMYELVLNLPKQDENFWQYARLHTTEAKRQFEQKDPIRALRLIKHVPIRAIKKAERGALMLNNLGRVSTADAPHLPELLDYYGYVRTKTLSAYAITATASTTNDRMAISLATACFDQPSIERLLQNIVDLLDQSTRPPSSPDFGELKAGALVAQGTAAT